MKPLPDSQVDIMATGIENILSSDSPDKAGLLQIAQEIIDERRIIGQLTAAQHFRLQTLLDSFSPKK